MKSRDRQKNPWTTLDSRMVYENPWIRVREDNVIRPDGKQGIYGVVQTRIATGVVALDTEMRVYMVGQYRYPLQMYSWEIIEGGSDDSESAIDAAKRELREEAGVIAHEWIQLGSVVHLSNCFSNEEAYVYLARDLEVVPREPDGTEILEIKTLPFSEVLQSVHEGCISDAISIIGILRAQHYLQTERIHP